MLRADVQGGGAAVDLGGAVVRVVVQVDAAATHDAALEVAEARLLLCSLVLVVLAADGQRDPVTGRHHDAGRPDLDLDLVDLTGRHRLPPAVRVDRPVGPAQLGVELAVRDPQPALRDRGVRVDGTLEHDLAPVRCEHPDDQEQVGVGGRRGHAQPGRDRAGQLEVGVGRRRHERQPGAQGVEGLAARLGARLLDQRGLRQVEVQARPPGARERPLVLVPVDEAVEGAYPQVHRRASVPAVVRTLQEVREERLLQADAVRGVELRPVLTAVQLEPLLRRAGADERLGRATQVPSLPAPVAGGQERDGDRVPRRGPLLVEAVEQPVAAHVTGVVGPVQRQLLVGERLRSRHQLTGVGRAAGPVAETVLHGADRPPVPDVDGGAHDPAVVVHVAVEVGQALPRDHRREVRRLQTRHQPLVDREVRDAEQPDLAAAPRLGPRPLDAVVEVAGATHGIGVDVARRPSPATRIDAYDGVTVRHPVLRVGRLPGRVAGARPLGHLGMRGDQAVPRVGVAVLEAEALAVRAVGDQGRVRSVVRRTEHVGPEDDAVVHRQRDVPLDAHAVAHLALVTHLQAPSAR